MNPKRTRQSWVLRQRPTHEEDMIAITYEFNKLEADGDPTDIVEQAYIPTKTMIARFRQAGMMYKEWKTGQFDFPDGKEDLDMDITTRQPGFDLADAAEIAQKAAQDIDSSIALQKAEIAAKKAAEDARDETLEEEVVPEVPPKKGDQE